MSNLSDKGATLQTPPLQGRGKGWGLSREQLEALKKRARDMRSNPTEPELRLWRNLSNGQLGGFKFRRQEVIGRTIVDFYCPAANLVIEVDGDTHADPQREARRDAYLQGFGLTVLHLANPDVMRNIDGVLQTILSALEGNHAPPVVPTGQLRFQRRGRSREAAEGVGTVTSTVSPDSPHPNPSPEGEGLVAIEAQKLLAISLEGSVG
jgi:very-short-patch-repair endonuclease